MDLSNLLGVVVGEALGMRRKPHRSTASFLLKAAGRNPGLAAGALLGVAGVAYGAWERSQRDQGPQQGPQAPRMTTPPPLPPPLPPAPDAATAEARELRKMRLVLAASQADGHVSTDEMRGVLDAAKQAGAESALLLDLATVREVETIVADVADDAERRRLYGLAFAVVRGDESVNDTERAWLTRLGAALRLTPKDVADIESAVSAGIDAEI